MSRQFGTRPVARSQTRLQLNAVPVKCLYEGDSMPAGGYAGVRGLEGFSCETGRHTFWKDGRGRDAPSPLLTGSAEIHIARTAL